MKFLILLGFWIIIDGYGIIVNSFGTSGQCNKDLGVGYRSLQPGFKRLPDANFKASSERPYCFARYGRFRISVKRKVFGVWCPVDDDKKPWFQVDLGKMTTVRKITISSTVRVHQYVTNYTVSYGYKEGPWFLIKDGSGHIKTFKGMEDIYTPSHVDIGAYITARYFRIHPKGKVDNYCLQLELHGCVPKKDCKVPSGVANSSIIHDYQLTASSEKQKPKHYAKDGRLHNKLQFPRQWGAWCANSNDMFPWLQVDMKIIREISGISTQGHPYVSYDAWTTQFKVNYSKNGIKWKSYNKGQLFTGNNDSSTIKTNSFKPMFLARFIKIIPTKWKNGDKGIPCLRVELYECDSNKKFTPSLIKSLNDRIIKRGQSLTLKCVFRGQPLMQVTWRKNGDFLSTDDDRINSIHIETKENTTAIIDFQRVTSADNAVFSCLAWYPGLSDIYERSGGVVTVLEPIPVLSIVNVSNTFVEVNLTFIEPLTIDVRGFVIRVKHINLAAYEVFIPVLFEELNQTRFLQWELGSLRPYSHYEFHVAMFYVENEKGKFTSKRTAFTLQDVPYGSPMKFVVQRLTPNSLGCVWSPPNITLRNGPITGYEVRFLKSVEEGESEQPQYMKLNETNIVLANLEAGAIYQVTVRAFTVIGPGPFVFPATLIFTGKSTAELNKINQMLITKKNAAAVSMRIQNITSDRGNLNKHDVELTIEILEKVVSVENTTDIGEYLINTVSNIMKANKTVLEESEMTNRTGTRYIKVLEKWLEGVDPKDKALQENSENVIVKKVYWHLGLLEEEIRFAEEEVAEITIPTKILRKQNKSEDVSIYFVFYKNNKFFRNSTVLDTKCVNGFTVTKKRTYTPVISGEIVGTKTQNLSEPVVLRFKMDSNATLEDSACVYWDFKGNNEKGKWSTDGCSVHSIVGNVIECHCNHLTNFAAMMDVYAHTSRVCGHHEEVISYITIFGCFLSLIGLFITFLTYFMFKSLHQELSAKVLVQLCVSLFIVVLMFIIGIQQVHRPQLCTGVAIVIHYFTLVSFLWMMIEAILMYYSFVKVWPPREGGDIYKSSVAAWGIPLIIVMTTYFSSRGSYGGEHYCHITGIPLYVTYLAPIGVVIVTNFTLFISIMHGLSTRPDSHLDRSHLERALERCRRAFGIMILMGLTWSFGFGLASKARLEFSYLFAITNGLQGFAIFIFYCVAQKNVRMAWKRFFTCDRRAKHERNTDSYSERLRLASAASTRTHTRGNSDASSLHRLVKNDHNSMVYAPIPLNYHNELIPPTEFHHHIATPPRSPRSPKISPLPTIKHDAILEDDGSLMMPAEDEMLDMQLQAAGIVDMPKPLKAKMDLKKYSSYRALSGPTSFDVFSLVKTPSAKSLHRDCHHRKSAEFINKKDKNHRLNRSSMIESSSLSSQHKNKMRVAKSMEQVNKKENFEGANATNISLLDIGSHRSSLIKKPDSIQDGGVSTDEKTLDTETDSDTVGPNYGFYPVNNTIGTMKSDATTMTDQNELAANSLVQNPLYGFKGENHRSPDDIMQWLHEGDDPSKSDPSDSDYSSTYYKTSRSSSMTELHGPLLSSASECSRPASKKKAREKEIIVSMVLTGTKSSVTPPRRLKSKRHSQRSRGKSDESNEKSDLSEAGYSASEEDLVDKDLFENRTKTRRKKTRRRSTNLSKNSQYVTLDEPSSHVSFV